MLYAYGATVVEIVRRKEFCESIDSILVVHVLTIVSAQFFYQRAQNILEVMTKMS
jgi:autophagy-related protein 11